MVSVSTYDLQAIRQALPALAELTYMNSGGEGIMAEPVLKSYVEGLERFERYGYWIRRTVEADYVRARERIAALVAADPDEVAVTRSGTDGVAIVLGAFDFKPDDELLIGSEEHEAILHPAAALITTSGVKVNRFIFHHDQAKTLESFVSKLTNRTRLAAFSHVSCETGIRQPAVDMIRAAHARGVQVLLDGAQTIGAIPVNFRDLDCDYLTGSAHKWLCGPKGSGMLVIRRDRIAGLIPRYVGGGSLSDPAPQNPEPLDDFKVAFNPAASRFEYGMRNPTVYSGIVAAIDYLDGIGIEAIADHERQVSTLLKKRLAAIDGVVVQTPIDWESSSAIVNFTIKAMTGNDIRTRLWNDWKIVQRAVGWPDGVRLSIAYFTSPEDVDRVIAAVTAIRDSAR